MIFLDANATTPPSRSAVGAMLRAARRGWANPSSSHRAGRQARQLVEDARVTVGQLVGVGPEKVIFTSGGTEAGNLAVHSAVEAHGGRHIISSDLEHPAVHNPLRQMERQGYEVCRVPVSPEGLVNMDAIRNSLRADTALVSVMWANNETGVIQPIPAIAQLLAGSGTLFHSDAVQAAGKMKLNASVLGVDFITISAHKFYGPKGVGALIACGKKASLRGLIHPQLLGGGQENGFRSGTENVPGIAGMGAAALDVSSHDPAAYDRVNGLRDAFEAGLARVWPDVAILGAKVARACNTSCFRIPSVPGSTLAYKLDKHGVAVSTGSACHTGTTIPSRTLLSMGLTPKQAAEVVRVSLTHHVTNQDIEHVLNVMEKLSSHIRASAR